MKANYFNTVFLIFVFISSAKSAFAQGIQRNDNDTVKNTEYLNGKKKIEEGKYAEAVLSLDNAISANPKNWRAYRYRGMAKKELKVYQESISDYSKALEINKDDTLSLKGRAISKLLSNDVIGAFPDYNRAIELDTSDANMYFGRAQCYYDFKEYGKAIVDFDRFIARYPKAGNGLAYLLRGQACFETKQYRKVINDLNVYLKMGGDFMGAYYKRGVSYFRLNIVDSAISDLEMFKAKYPKTTPTYKFLGVAYAAKMDSVSSRRAFEEGLKLYPDDLEACYMWAGAEINFKNYSKALELLEKVFPFITDPTSQNFDWLGQAKAGVGDTLGAEEAYEKALKVDSASRRVYAIRIKFHYPNPKYSGILLTDFNKLIHLTTDSEYLSLLYASRGLVNGRTSNIDKAEADVKKAMELFPKEPLSYLVNGLLLFRQDKYEEALKNFRKSVELDPKLGEAYLLLACTYGNMGDYKNGCKELKKAERLGVKTVKDFNDRICSGRSRKAFSIGEMEQLICPFIKEAIVDRVTD